MFTYSHDHKYLKIYQYINGHMHSNACVRNFLHCFHVETKILGDSIINTNINSFI